MSPQRAMMIQAMCQHLTAYGGSALIGDYGHWGGKGDTFRVCTNFYRLIYLNIISVGFSKR